MHIATHGILRHVVDGLVGHSSARKLESNGETQVDQRLRALGRYHHALGAHGARDRRGDLTPDFEATGSNAGSNGRNDSPTQGAYGGSDHTGYDAAPPRVYRRHAVIARQQHRNAVGDPNPHCISRNSSHERIAVRHRSQSADLEHACTMHLIDLRETLRRKPYRAGQPRQIFAERFRVAKERHVQAVERRHAHAAPPCREAVGEPLGKKPRGSQERHARLGMHHRNVWYHVSVMLREHDPFVGRDILDGQFQILRKIGSGGMGSVYQALQPAMNRMVAVKILHPKHAERQDLVSRFGREARALSHLTHPNTVKVYLYGELDDGSLYIIMEFLEGRNLNQTIRADGPMPVARALPILIQVSYALEEAHRAGIIHRDLKPENIFLARQGGIEDFPKVLDFGLAKVSDRELRPGSLVLTQEGMVFGTPEFMSPEQAQGRTLTPGSDIYSLAVILYEVLTGKLPFDARNPMHYIQLHVSAKPAPLEGRVPGLVFPPLLETVIDKALAKNVGNRFGSAAEFAAALQAVLNGATKLPPARAAFAPGTVPTPFARLAVPAPATHVSLREQSSDLPAPGASAKKASLGLLVVVAATFLVVGAVATALFFRSFIH